MFTNRIPKLFVVLVVLAVMFGTASFATRSATVPDADRSYDSLEQVRAQRSSAVTVTDSTYDLIEQIRNGRGIHECLDVSLSEVARCQQASQASISESFPAIDECFDVSLSEVASCHEASQVTAP